MRHLFLGFVALVSLLVPFSASAQEKPFSRSDLNAGAARLESQLQKELVSRPRSVADLRKEADAALAAKDTRTHAQRLGEIAISAEKDAALWLRYARALGEIAPSNAPERNIIRDRTAAAAYLAYRRTANRAQEAEALEIIGRIYADRELWRPALDTIKAALERRETAELKSFYENLRETHGFRVLDYSVDADVAAPRACIQFSEPLSPKADFAPFISVQGIDKLSVTNNEQQICIEGLRHGETYSVTARRGIPSKNGEVLANAAELQIYVRDRKADVRFSGRAYVLPRTGQKGIPVISVNTRRLKVQVVRIGERSLLPSALDGQFRQSLSRGEIEQLAQNQGATVFNGELEVTSELNKEVTTAFPIDEAIKDLKAGVYVMIATPADAVGRPQYSNLATQWFVVSDLGLTAITAEDGLHVFVRDLGNANAVANAELKLLAKNNEVLATAKTDAKGFAKFDAGLVRGTGGLAPAVLIAERKGTDYAFLSLTESPFDLTDRGVAGRLTPGPLDAYVFTERGVYRSGETVHVTALLRDAKAKAISVPLTFILSRPDGAEDRRIVINSDEAGGRSFDMPLLPGATTGTWRLRAYADPKASPVGEVAFLVEDYVPDRIEFDLKAATLEIGANQPAKVAVDGRYLFGPPAATLDLEGEIEIRASQLRRGFDGFSFGLADETFTPIRRPLSDLPKTDAKGHADLSIELPELPRTTRALEAQITIRMNEAGGRAIERRIVIPIASAAPAVGIRPQFKGLVGEGEKALFDVVLVNPDGKLAARKNMKWTIYRVETRYQWYRVSGSWDYEPVRQTRKIAEGKLDASAEKPVTISADVPYGRYRLEVTSSEPNGPAGSYAFDSGFYGETSADTPDRLEMSIDKAEYNEGDTLTVSISPRIDGAATVMVVGDKVHAVQQTQVGAAGGKVTFRVGADWGPGAYVVAFHHRPLDVQKSRMPSRAIGVAWFGVGRAAKTLGVKLELPKQLRPNTTWNIPVTVSGANGGTARVVVAAVDVGILNLTNHKTPAPDTYYLGQRRLSGDIRDLYGALIDGMQGVRGKIRTGGDANALEMAGNPPSQAPLVLFSGMVALDKDGKANVQFEVPAFDGSVRVMAAAWTEDKVGHAAQEVIIRDPVVVQATLPRFLAANDRSTLRLDVTNVEGAAGDYKIALVTEGAVEVSEANRTFTLQSGARTGFTLDLIGKGTGAGSLSVRLTGPNGLSIERKYAFLTRPAFPPIERRTVRELARGESIVIDSNLLADVVPGTGAVSLTVSPQNAIDVPSLLLALDRYPYGCSEQITSRALPLLYVNDLASESQLALDKSIDERIKEAIGRVLARQNAEGAFGLWNSSSAADTWLHAYVTDFLTRAREKGFSVPENQFKLALNRLRNAVQLGNNRGGDQNTEAIAYALYVLARNGVAPVGDLRYLADAKLDDLSTPLSRGQLAAALSLLGDKVRAEKVFASALSALPRDELAPVAGRDDYGSPLRDAASIVALATEAGFENTARLALARLEVARGLTPHTSTQENAWMVLAARAFAKEAQQLSLTIDGVEHKGNYFRTIRAADLQGKTFRIANNGDRPVQVVIGIRGAPQEAEPAAEKGFKILRTYRSLDGQPVDPSKVQQNQRMVVVLRVNPTEQVAGRLLLADFLPAGFEIDNPRLVAGGETGNLKWIGQTTETAYTEFRDDRFVAAFNRIEGDRSLITVAYIVRAVSPGKYAHPPAIIEDMYRPDRFARTEAGSVEVLPASK
ncbi:MAG: alpha-2-macroglobulin family protein [Xanthobacteraceae bacterium]|nr:alpha-2-macroglobulin family protein [Xanthobacteraceae bacterium]